MKMEFRPLYNAVISFLFIILPIAILGCSLLALLLTILFKVYKIGLSFVRAYTGATRTEEGAVLV
jgi:hypothetical protein